MRASGSWLWAASRVEGRGRGGLRCAPRSRSPGDLAGVPADGTDPGPSSSTRLVMPWRSELLTQGRPGRAGRSCPEARASCSVEGAAGDPSRCAPLLAVPEVSGGERRLAECSFCSATRPRQSPRQSSTSDEAKRRGGVRVMDWSAASPPVLIRVPAVTLSSRAQNRRCQIGEPPFALGSDVVDDEGSPSRRR